MEQKNKGRLIDVVPLVLQQHGPDTDVLISGIINLDLVAMNVRKGFLLEGMNFDPSTRRESISFIVGLARQWNLSIWQESNTRFLFTREKVQMPDTSNSQYDERLAHILGFYCIGHDYGNADVERVRVNVYIRIDRLVTVNIVSEFCERSKLGKTLKHLKSYYRDRVRAIQRVLPRTWKCFAEIYTTSPFNRRLELLHNREFGKIAKEYKRDFLDDVANRWTWGSFLEDCVFELIRVNPELAEHIWRKYFDDEYIVSTLESFGAYLTGEQLNEFTLEIDHAIFGGAQKCQRAKLLTPDAFDRLVDGFLLERAKRTRI